MDHNAYLLTCRSTGEALLIDAANEARPLRLPQQPARDELIVTWSGAPSPFLPLPAA